MERIPEMTLAERIKSIRARKAKAEVAALYELMVGRFIVLNGPKGSGKTSSGIHLAYQLREMTGNPVVVISSEMGMNESFGPHKFISLHDFICQMRMLNRAAKETEPDWSPVDIEVHLLNQRGCPDKEHDPEFVLLANGQWKHRDVCSEKALENSQGEGEPCWSSQNGVILYNAVVLMDESKEIFGGVYSSNPVTKLAYGFVQRMRHLGVTLIAMSPFREDIGPSARGQVDTYGICSTFKDIRGVPPYTKIEFDDGILRLRTGLRFPAKRYWTMYTTRNLLTIRESHLNIASRHV